MPSDSDLIQKFIGGNPEAFKIIAGYMNPIFNSFQARFGFETEDLKIMLLEELRIKFDSGNYRIRKSLNALVRRAAKSRCLDHIRYMKRHPELFSAEESNEKSQAAEISNPEDELMSKERDYALYMIYTAASEDCRRAWDFLFDGDKKYSEIAVEMGKSEGAVKSLISWCRQWARKMRKVYKDYF
jgi:RNA polymerase sigma factor (sigma-70 family)